MAMNIIDLLKDTNNGLLSKIKIGNTTYELKDLIAREKIGTLADLIDALSAKIGTVEDGENLAALVAALEEAAANLEANKADKTQVATDIETAVKAEADIARAAEKANADAIAEANEAISANADEIEAINALLNTVDSEDNITSLKELATWVEEHGGEAAEMSKSITANAEAIAKEAKDRADADTAFDGRLADVEALLTGGEGSVGEQIADAKDEAIETAKDYTDEEIGKLGDLAKKDEADLDLKALAHKDSATGTIAGETISGVKATGTSTGSITVELQASEKEVASAGKFTPAGSVTGTVVPSGSVAVTVSSSAADATLTKGDYTPAGIVSVALTGTSFNQITGVGTQASFVEGEFTPATISKEDVTANYATEGLVGAVEGECLTFTAAGIAAITATKVNSFDGGAKAADTFVANSLPTMAAHNVGVENATFTGTLAEDLVVTNVSYAKANAEAAATFTGNTNDITATFAGTEGDIAVAGKCHDYAVKTAEFNGAAIELAVGDIVVAAKDVTVQ